MPSHPIVLLPHQPQFDPILARNFKLFSFLLFYNRFLILADIRMCAATLHIQRKLILINHIYVSQCIIQFYLQIKVIFFSDELVRYLQVDLCCCCFSLCVFVCVCVRASLAINFLIASFVILDVIYLKMQCVMRALGLKL